ncbi:MAG: disulfide oxidoreductase [Alphaproteobacteria bacterium]|nr:disulfide oxidoreductase [Alphaproteobacteria bacterium]
MSTRNISISTADPIAVLGPTNTGKTWYAMERMLGHASGMFGFPLRLLARENYDRAVARVGAGNVALITGEEKIIPPGARYFLCTVEAMPMDKRVDFMAVDEVQLAADPERGHVFTDRILNARGREETLLLGAETIRRVLEELLPHLEVMTRQRLSKLSWAGQKKVTRLPRRSAVVAFSTAEVYKLAELIRAQRGGTAIVMGALSPRTRNAQVEMFQSGDVDYMVATDAIGMGLNMDINHVALAGDVKFDGRRPRKLSPAELGQIAGRAGRHTTDGSFGITDHCTMLEDDVIEAIENHRFRFLNGVYYRNSRLDFSSPDALMNSLEARPPSPLMTRKADADDQQALAALMERDDIRVLAHGEAQVELLYDVCQVPDYQREYTDSHAQMLARIYTALAEGKRLPKDWVSAQMQRLNRPDGDIDTLMSRLSGIRTWSYITQRQHWLDDAEEFQGLARSIEDRVSDSLHLVLTQRFVDRRAAVLSRRLKENTTLMSSIKSDGTVIVEGEDVGQLDGFVFTPRLSGGDEEGPVLAAARKALPDEISARVKALAASADAAFKLNARGQIFWREALIGKLVKGDGLYQPKAEVRASTLLEGDQLKTVQDRLNAFAADYPKTVLEKAVALTGDTLTGTARGIAYQVYEALGTLPSPAVAEMVKELDDDGRRQLALHGVRLGVDMIYMADLLKPAQIDAKALLWSIFNDQFPQSGPPPAGRVAIDHIDGVSDAYWLATGYRRLGGRVMRVDMAERLSAVIRTAARGGKFQISEEMMSLAGATRDQMAAILIDLNYAKVDDIASEDPEKPPIPVFERKQRPAKRGKAEGGKPRQAKSNGGRSDGGKPNGGKRSSQDKPGQGKHGQGKPGAATARAPKQPDPNSPFAILAQLKAQGK